MTDKYKKMHVFFQETATWLTIDLGSMKVENWKYDEFMSTNYKTSDECTLKFEDKEGKLHRYQGYVPRFFPGEHYGDYIMLAISKSGIVQGLKMTDKEIDGLLEKSY